MADITTTPDDSVPTATAMADLPPIFKKLPLELRQCIYRYVATDSNDERDLRIEFALSENKTDGSGDFKAPVLDLLIKMKEVSTAMYAEAVEHLTGPLFTWVLVSELQPHMYLLRALRKSYPKDILARVSHVHLECYSPGIDSDLILYMRHAYVHHIGSKYDPDDHPEAYASKVHSDVGYGLSLVLVAFPAVSRLDIELDIVDWIHYNTTYPVMLKYIKAPAAYWGLCSADIGIKDVARIGGIRSAAQTDVHLHWRDLGIKERLDVWGIDDEAVPVLKKSFVKYLKRQLVAKSITAHG